VIPAEVQVDSRAEVFAQLVDRQLNDAYRLAGYILGNAPDAEDAVQEAIIRARCGAPTGRASPRSRG
jgi:DNA-directed RNA polymerase specialized sigma24 family protein